MESSLPFAVRIAAGLLSEAVGRARRLPADLTGLPVSVIGHVAKLSFELNQQLAELATEGDRLLAGMRSSEEPPERTAWSTIDDEDEVAAKDPQAAATWDTHTDAPDAPPPHPDPSETPDAPGAGAGAPGLILDDEPTVPPASPRLVRDPATPGTAAAAESGGRPSRAAGRRVGATGSAGARVGTDPALAPVPAADGGPNGDGTPFERSLIDDIGELEVERPAPLVGLPSIDHISPVDISGMTVGQLRSRIRSWNAEQVRAALEQEQREKARPAFLTVLTNRLSTLARGGA